MLEVILSNQIADQPPHYWPSTGQEWSFHIATVRAHIGQIKW